VDLGDNALVGGVDDIEGLAFLAFDEFVVDEPGFRVSGSVQRWLSSIEELSGASTSGVASLTDQSAARTCRKSASQAGRKSF
jgi:hypothetical protein